MFYENSSVVTTCTLKLQEIKKLREWQNFYLTAYKNNDVDLISHALLESASLLTVHFM